MYKIEHGILTSEKKKVFAIGQSYYPSFHHAKYPVPPHGDRIGEMKKDLKLMNEMGFNHVRFAAIGSINMNSNEELTIDTPFVEAMIKEAEENNISVSVRLQGYVVNLHNYQDVLMIDENGQEQDVNIWYDFIQSTLHHQGLAKDNEIWAEGLAAHYSSYKNVVACQIYNEPHYPGDVFFDYHPLTVAAYRRWLTEKGIMDAKEAESYEPPRTRKEQTPQRWAQWRLFSRDSMTSFLAQASSAAKKGANLPMYTCYTACQASMVNVYRGVDYFGGAKAMDIIGYTCYLNAEGSDYFTMNILLDMNASAAKLTGKESWCVELDSRTTIPTRIFNKNTYAVVGSGAKGILYYQWRGDYPSEATPIPNGCGLVNYDGSKTPNYDNATDMVALLNLLSDYIVNSNPVSYKIGILHSDYATFYCDALENNNEKRTEVRQNSCMADLFRIYYDVRKASLGATFITAEQLSENKLDLKTLLVPKENFLSEEEKAKVEDFRKNGGTVYALHTMCNDFTYGAGYCAYGKPFALYSPYMEFMELADMNGWKPLAKVDSYQIALQVLEGRGYKLLVLTNISCQEKPVSSVISCNFDFTKATLYTGSKGRREMRIENDKIFADNIIDGAIIVVE